MKTKKDEQFYLQCAKYIRENEYEKLPYHLFEANGLLEGVDSRLVEVVRYWLSYLPYEAVYDMCEEMFPEDWKKAYEAYENND